MTFRLIVAGARRRGILDRPGRKNKHKTLAHKPINDLAEKVRERQTSLKKGPYDFPMACMHPGLLQKIREKSLAAEEALLPEFFRSPDGRAKLLSEFDAPSPRGSSNDRGDGRDADIPLMNRGDAPRPPRGSFRGDWRRAAGPREDAALRRQRVGSPRGPLVGCVLCVRGARLSVACVSTPPRRHNAATTPRRRRRDAATPPRRRDAGHDVAATPWPRRRRDALATTSPRRRRDAATP